MNGEATVVMLFLTVRVFLFGGIMLAFPRISRKGLMFGTYLGEEQAEDTRRELLRSWDKGTALIMAVTLMVGWGIGLAGWPVTGNLTGTAVLLIPFLPLYVWMYRKAQRLAPPDAARQAMRSAASLEVDETRGSGFAVLALTVCVVASLALVGYTALSFQTMPDRIPTMANLWGYGERLTEKSLLTVVLVPTFNLVFAPAFALMALLITRSKRSLRGGSGGRSAQAQETFRVAMSLRARCDGAGHVLMDGRHVDGDDQGLAGPS